jgi:hypothetical protein
MKILQWERVTRGDDQDYMWRLILIRCWLFRLYIHIFVDSDDECQHDHPWDFISLILWGGYWEVDKNKKKKWHGPGSVLFRRASWQHQVIIPKGKRAYTIVFCTTKYRDWGFFTPSGWIHFRRYSHVEHCPSR